MKMNEEDDWPIDFIDDWNKEVPPKESKELQESGQLHAGQKGNCSYETNDYDIFGKGMDFKDVMKNIEQTIVREEVEEEHMKQDFYESMYISQFLDNLEPSKNVKIMLKLQEMMAKYQN